MRHLAARLIGENAGNTALTFALLTPVLVLLAGGAIDVTNASMRQSNLQQAADATAVGAVARTSPGYQAALTQPLDGPVTATNLNANALAIFNANRNASSDTAIPNFSVAVTKTTTASNVAVSSVVTASGTYTTNFLGLIGQKTIKLAATANASDNIPAYINFYLLLDNTPSQGVAATQAGISTMVGATSDQCAFACHDLNANGNDYYALAKKLKVNTRIYNVAQASANLLTTAQSTETANGLPTEFGVALYDFGTTPSDPSTSPGFVQVFPALAGTTSTDLASASKSAAAIDVMGVYGQGEYSDEDSNLNAPLVYAAQNLKSSGNGASALAPQQVIFFVSDGVNDTYNCSYNNGNTCRQITPLDYTPCTQLKAHGIKIAVLYTTYLPLTTNGFWQAWVAPFQNWIAPWTTAPDPANDQIAANMKACASTGLYFQVDSSGDINQAMQALFQKVIASVRVTG